MRYRGKARRRDSWSSRSTRVFMTRRGGGVTTERGGRWRVFHLYTFFLLFFFSFFRYFFCRLIFLFFFRHFFCRMIFLFFFFASLASPLPRYAYDGRCVDGTTRVAVTPARVFPPFSFLKGGEDALDFLQPRGQRIAPKIRLKTGTRTKRIEVSIYNINLARHVE